MTFVLLTFGTENVASWWVWKGNVVISNEATWGHSLACFPKPAQDTENPTPPFRVSRTVTKCSNKKQSVLLSQQGVITHRIYTPWQFKTQFEGVFLCFVFFARALARNELTPSRLLFYYVFIYLCFSLFQAPSFH